MKVDAYHSQSKPSYGLIVPAGVDPAVLTGAAGTAVPKLRPLVRAKTNVDLNSLATGDLLDFLEKQIASEGAGLMRTNVTFSEVG